VTPTFLTLAEVLDLHEESIRRYGGTSGIRDLGLLQSALAQPESTFGGQYLHPDFASMAAAYLFHIVQNHPFLDGNKRTGTAAARVFILMNGATFNPPNHELEEFEFMRRHTK
jgi:death on curing protein